ncbi:MAG TPA: M15 family peptidase [Sphingomicrobium sp.]|nr:M15 family peptidase [Sphingomicrobium sp.]
MAYSLGARSRAKLVGVQPRLVSVVERAIAITAQDFSVHDGLRTLAQQREFVRRGVSKTMASKHLRQGDGFGHAVDLVPFIGGQLRWEWKPIFVIAAAVFAAVREQQVAMIWGGVWDRRVADLPDTPAGLEAAVNAYVARRRGMGKTAFIDGPHYELVT